MNFESITVSHGSWAYEYLLSAIRSNRALAHWLDQDAESKVGELDAPGTTWSVVYLRGERPEPVAWAAARHLPDGNLKGCCNYVRRDYRREDIGVDLYRQAYMLRHRDVISKHAGPQETYLFAQPIPLHEADGWRKTGESGPGKYPGNHWWRLVRNQ